MIGIIGFRDLKKLKIYIDLKPQAKEKLRELIRKEYNTLSHFAKKTDLPVKESNGYYRNNDLDHFFRGHKISMQLFLKIIKPFDEFSDAYIEKNLLRLGSKRGSGDLFYPKIPINFNNEYGMTIISGILHDGGISKAKIVHYRNNEKVMRERFIAAVGNLFGTVSRGEFNTSLFFPKIIGEILTIIGLENGSKVYLNTDVPSFVFDLNSELKGIFLRQAFDDDGCVGNKMISICSHIDTEDGPRIPKNILAIRRLLTDLNILCSEPCRTKEYEASNRKRERWSIFITGRRNLLTFKERVSFNIRRKRLKLEEILNSYQQNQNLQNETFLMAIEKAKDIEKLEGFFTISLLAERMDRDYHHTKQLVWRMEKEGIVNRVTQEPPFNFTLEHRE